MILALDVGNGSIKWARFAQGRIVSRGRLPLDGTPEPEGEDVIAAVSVNPAALKRLEGALAGIRVVGVDLPIPIAVHYDPPEDCGPDRVMGVLGALHLRPEAAGVLVLDSGTCLTATLGLRGKGVIGGAIAPGIDLMARALADGTQTLPRVEPTQPRSLIGRSTGDAIRAGVWAAFIGAAKELVRGVRAEFGEGFDVVAAGTGAEALGSALEEVDAVHADATLWGVVLAVPD